MKPRSTVEIPLDGDIKQSAILKAFNTLGEDSNGLRQYARMHSAQSNDTHMTLSYFGDMSEEQIKLSENPSQWFEDHPEALEALEV